MINLKSSFDARAFWRVAVLALALSGSAAWAATTLGQSFTVAGTGSFTLNSVTFQNVSYPSPSPGVQDVINIFAYDPAGLNGGAAGSDNATPILFTSSGVSTVGLLSTYTFSGATLVGGVSYFAVFDKSGLFDFGGDTFAGGALLIGSDNSSSVFGSLDATNFSVSVTSAVPEPSTYAAIFGACALGAVVVVRRRRAIALR